MGIDLSDIFKIGNGAHWNVYRPKTETNISFQGRNHSHVVFKISKEGKGQIKKNIETYTKVKDANLPTLNLYSSYWIDSTECIIAEDVNPLESETIFVSPNTGRSLPTENSIIIDQLLNRNNEKEYEFLAECAEVRLKENKLSIINNFDSFLDTIFRDMKKATMNGLGLCEDAFFFGLKPSDGIIQYKIADFDTIITYDIPNTKEVLNGNTRTFLNSYWEFFDQFVIDSIAGEYKLRIEEISKSYL